MDDGSLKKLDKRASSSPYIRDGSQESGLLWQNFKISCYEKQKSREQNIKQNNEESRDAYSNAGRKDGGKWKCNERAKINMDRILQEIQDLWKENQQLEDIKDKQKPNLRIKEVGDCIDVVETWLQTIERVVKKHARSSNPAWA